MPLVDGQGNFGNIDGDNAGHALHRGAADQGRAMSCSTASTKDTVDFQDRTMTARTRGAGRPAGAFPNLLANGSGGIAVGMATNIPPHNLGEVIDGTLAMIENPNISMELDLLEIVPGPRFSDRRRDLGPRWRAFGLDLDGARQLSSMRAKHHTRNHLRGR
jgi:DNA gyrase subunit A